ncbi:MAG: HAD family hydrolase [Culicoidibacterales bacterium]
MKQHLIITDLDGTALESNSNIGMLTRYYMLKAQQEGHIISIATGRSANSSLKFYHELNIQTHFSNLNGNYIWNPRNHNDPKIFHPFKSNPVLDLLNSPLNDHIEAVLFETKDGTILDRENEYLINIWNVESKGLFQPKIEMPSTHTIDEETAMVAIYCQREHTETIFNFLAQYFSSTFTARQWAHDFANTSVIEVYNPMISKVEGVEFLAHKYNISKDRIMCFGDQTNDLEMIEYAGLGVAMKNANPELLKIADAITERPNTESGVGYFLQKYFKL